MIMLPYDWPWSSPQLTGHADFWHPTGYPAADDLREILSPPAEVEDQPDEDAELVDLPPQFDPKNMARTGIAVLDHGLPPLPDVLSYQMAIPVAYWTASRCHRPSTSPASTSRAPSWRTSRTDSSERSRQPACPCMPDPCQNGQPLAVLSGHSLTGTVHPAELGETRPAGSRGSRYDLIAPVSHLVGLQCQASTGTGHLQPRLRCRIEPYLIKAAPAAPQARRQPRAQPFPRPARRTPGHTAWYADRGGSPGEPSSKQT